MLDKYEGGFSIGSDWSTVEWLLNEKHSTDKILYFQAYDANLWPMPNMTTWKSDSEKKQSIDAALKFTQEFEGKVYLDDVKIK